MKMNKILVPLALLCCLAYSTAKPVASTRVAGVEQGLLTAVVADGAPPTKYSLAERMRFFNVPGVSITVFERGKVAWRRGYGWADEAHRPTRDARNAVSGRVHQQIDNGVCHA